MYSYMFWLIEQSENERQMRKWIKLANWWRDSYVKPWWQLPNRRWGRSGMQRCEANALGFASR